MAYRKTFYGKRREQARKRRDKLFRTTGYAATAATAAGFEGYKEQHSQQQQEAEQLIIPGASYDLNATISSGQQQSHLLSTQTPPLVITVTFPAAFGGKAAMTSHSSPLPIDSLVGAAATVLTPVSAATEKSQHSDTATAVSAPCDSSLLTRGCGGDIASVGTVGDDTVDSGIVDEYVMKAASALLALSKVGRQQRA